MNIYDFLDNLSNNRPQKFFNTERELAVYTMETGKIYPKAQAKEEGPFRDLLAHIFDKGRHGRK